MRKNQKNTKKVLLRKNSDKKVSESDDPNILYEAVLDLDTSQKNTGKA